MPVVSVPRFYLYGEPHRLVDSDFVHAEMLDDRSRPNKWKIVPHAHADLVQLFLLRKGGGLMRAEDASFVFEAPAVLIVPQGVVHEFHWTSESVGSVVTLSVRHLASLDDRYPGLSNVFASAGVASLDVVPAETISGAVAALMLELGWSAVGHRAAVDAALLSILVEALRAIGPGLRDAARAPGQHAALVARLRSRIEERFRHRETISSYAAALGTSESRLRVACARIAGQSPMAMLDQRANLEAKRLLLFTNLSVAEVGYSVGFMDPAYFTRFFTRHAGVCPRSFRSGQSR